MKIGLVRYLLIVTSVLEGATGLALMAMPSLIALILLDSSLNDSASVIITRVAGAALVSIALVCWFSRNIEGLSGLVIALLFYNLAAVVFLGYAGLHEDLNGIALWPVIASHIVMTAWSAKCLIYSCKYHYD